MDALNKVGYGLLAGSVAIIIAYVSMSLSKRKLEGLRIMNRMGIVDYLFMIFLYGISYIGFSIVNGNISSVKEPLKVLLFSFVTFLMFVSIPFAVLFFNTMDLTKPFAVTIGGILLGSEKRNELNEYIEESQRMNYENLILRLPSNPIRFQEVFDSYKGKLINNLNFESIKNAYFESSTKMYLIGFAVWLILFVNAYIELNKTFLMKINVSKQESTAELKKN